MNKNELQEKINAGFIQAKIIFEIVGSPKDYVMKVINAYIDNMKKDKDLIFLSEDCGEPLEERGLWSTFLEAELLVNGLEKFVWLCINFMPASIDIIKPETFTFKDKDLTNWLNDVLSALHEVSILTKQLNSQNRLLLKNTNALVRNLIILALKKEKKPMDAKELGRIIGIPDNDLKPYFEAMIKENSIIKVKNKYDLKK